MYVMRIKKMITKDELHWYSSYQYCKKYMETIKENLSLDTGGLKD